MDSRVQFKLDRTAASNIDAYIEYRHIVGDDDNGKLFSPEEYEDYKRKVVPQRIKNRLYVSWTNPNGMDCKLIGPETQCFCQHRYKQHKTDFDGPVTSTSELTCKVKNCHCSGFKYVPKNGTQPLRCHCKHVATDHNERKPYLCNYMGCKCTGFKTSYRCGCGYPASDHVTLVESKEDREKRGKPVGHDTPYIAMGGLTGLSSLIDGYMRLDDSGIGKPPPEFFEDDIPTSSNGMMLQPKSVGLVARKKEIAQKPAKMRTHPSSSSRSSVRRVKKIQERPPWDDSIE